MNNNSDISAQLAERVREAHTKGTALNIHGGGSKDFYGRQTDGEPLDVSAHRGIVSYEPTELVVTARAGTPLNDIEAALSERGQMIPFGAPRFVNCTLGGAVASGLSGPGRPYYGALRDFVLGVKIINGKGEILNFGGQVMKNVAGYDVSRTMVGALGTLGVLVEISIKVLPQPVSKLTVQKSLATDVALDAMNRWSGRPLPITAACYDGNNMYLRLCGSNAAVDSARKKLGGELVETPDEFWQKLRDHRHGFFSGERPLWRLSVPPATPQISLPGKWYYDWGGAQRWLRSDAPTEKVQAAAGAVGGYAECFRHGDRAAEVFHPLPAPLMKLHRNLKQAFDPRGILNPGRLYKDF